MDDNQEWITIDTYAKKWIQEAGAIIRNSFSKELMVTSKSSPNDLVTNMDHQIEKFFINHITKTYPDHRILGEEGFGDNITSLEGIVWIIDPIDGTMNFVHQQRNFAISIGIYKDGVGMIGLIYDVVSEELYHAQKGHGAFFNDVPLPKLPNVNIEESIIGMNATWVTENKRINPTTLAPLVNRVRGTRSYGSAALEMAYVASGRLDAYITMRLSPWDFAAGIILIEEVGGKVTTTLGKPINLAGENSVFACNSCIHEEIIGTYLKGTYE